MHHEIVPWPLADDAEVVYVGFHVGASGRAAEIKASNACALILGPGRLAHTAYSLRVVTRIEMEAATAIKRHMEEIVEVATEIDEFTGTSCRTRNEHREADGKYAARRHRRGARLGCRGEYQAEHHGQQWQGDADQSLPATKEDGLPVHVLLPRFLFVEEKYCYTFTPFSSAELRSPPSLFQLDPALSTQSL
jgi:hypothetical protein